jgi:hypothetical protein
LKSSGGLGRNNIEGMNSLAENTNNLIREDGIYNPGENGISNQYD